MSHYDIGDPDCRTKRSQGEEGGGGYIFPVPLWIEGRAIDVEMVWMLIDISLVWTWNVNDESRVCAIDDLIGSLIWFNVRMRCCNT